MGIRELFSLEGRVAVVTGASGVLGGAMARGLAEAGARDALLERFGAVHVLVNAAGGNVPAATADDRRTVFDLPEDALRQAVDLNFFGALLPTQVFGEALAAADGDRCIVNVSSMSVDRALTRIVGYSAGKAAAENLTRWLAVDLARRYGPGLRVNALAPGFFLGEQNRAMLVADDGGLTARGRAIVEGTPAAASASPRSSWGPWCGSAAPVPGS